MPEKPPAEPTFEQALEKLEAIVEAMEDGKMPLDQLLVRFEEGNQLLKVCEGRLKEAELRVEQLKRDKAGNAAFVPFAAERSPS